MRPFTDSPGGSAANAPPTTWVDAHALPIEFVKSHRNDEGWEFVRTLLLGVGVIALMFLLAAAGILLAFGFVMWVL